MATIYLVHWHEAEAKERARTLRDAGHAVRVGWTEGGGPTREIRARPPDVVVVDLRRLPSHGRGVAATLREGKATRGLPIVFVEGDPEKTARAARDFPESVVAPWRRIRGAVRAALANPPAAAPAPTRPDYSGTPLPKKLGVKARHVLATLGAPADFAATLGPLPDGVTTRTQSRGACDVIVLFVKTRGALERRFPTAHHALADGGGLWVAWPKKTSGVPTDLSQPVVQRVGLDAGLVDNKICAIDATWSGQRFMRRRA